MDFTFSAEQEAMRDSVRSYLAEQAEGGYVRAMLEDERGFGSDVWDAMVGLGWTGLLVPESAGGLGLGLVDLVPVQEEMCRLAFPGPFFSSAVCATLAAVKLDAGAELDRLGQGERATVALEEGGAADPLSSVQTLARQDGDRWLLSGTKPMVLDGATADFAFVVARDESGLGTFVVADPSAQAVPALDVTRKMARLVLDSTPTRRIGPPGDHTVLWRRIMDDISIALAAETVGAAERALSMAIEYAKVRVQFDRPIATFQAIKHKIVDMLHQLELARVGTHWAAWCSDVDDPLRAAASAACKAFVAEAAVMVTGESI
ncbi:MAG TPA: acyl-CoA dehydrogenase family protein, partial [Acidimicrobiales bacterium]|nr:acyl-CoA dehydrogenase family protein [Acidimicrobiales bacterium]